MSSKIHVSGSGFIGNGDTFNQVDLYRTDTQIARLSTLTVHVYNKRRLKSTGIRFIERSSDLCACDKRTTSGIRFRLTLILHSRVEIIEYEICKRPLWKYVWGN